MVDPTQFQIQLSVSAIMSRVKVLACRSSRSSFGGGHRLRVERDRSTHFDHYSRWKEVSWHSPRHPSNRCTVEDSFHQGIGPIHHHQTQTAESCSSTDRGFHGCTYSFNEHGWVTIGVPDLDEARSATSDSTADNRYHHDKLPPFRLRPCRKWQYWRSAILPSSRRLWSSR